MNKVLFVFILGLAFSACNLDKASSLWTIYKKGNHLYLKAGILEREIALSENEASTLDILVDGNNIITGSREFSLNISKASPNEEPVGPGNSMITGVSQQDAVENNTDALDIEKNDSKLQQSVQWVDTDVISGNQSQFIENIVYDIDHSRSGKTRLTLTYILGKNKWDGITAKIIYEIYDNYPVIRKWVEFKNTGDQWVKLDNLKIDDIELSESYSNQTLLAPDSREINSSLIAFSDNAAARGIISASEIPSKLKQIFDEGASGYHPDYFEWVLGPDETFTSEPVFMYGFSGESNKTVSAVSTALDRCVESDFRAFLNQYIVKPVRKGNDIAPVFCTWTNYNANINGGNMREAAEIASRMGFKCFQLDAGWSDTGPDGGWAVSTPKPNQKFPDLKGLSQHILSNNMKPGLWYSVFLNEQQVNNSGNEPVLYSLPLIKRAGGLGLSFCYDKSREQYVNDLVYLHQTYSADYFKQDLSNICFGDMARGHESRTMKESYLRGLRGLFATQDEIHKKVPEVWLQLSHEIYWETPGPEADIAVLKHADSYHSAPNEYWGAGNRKELVNPGWNFDVKDVQEQLIRGASRARNLWYAHRGLPLERIEVFGAVTTNYKGSLSPEIIDRQICSWFMGAPLSFSGDLTSLTEENVKQYHSRFSMLERLQKKYGIYDCFQYSGVPQPTDTDWHWWGKLNEQGCGAVVVLRGSEGDESRRINIPWVQAEKKYLLKALLGDQEMGVFSGTQLQNGELKLSLASMGQEIIEISAME